MKREESNLTMNISKIKELCDKFNFNGDLNKVAIKQLTDEVVCQLVAEVPQNSYWSASGAHQCEEKRIIAFWATDGECVEAIASTHRADNYGNEPIESDGQSIAQLMGDRKEEAINMIVIFFEKQDDWDEPNRFYRSVIIFERYVDPDFFV